MQGAKKDPPSSSSSFFIAQWSEQRELTCEFSSLFFLVVSDLPPLPLPANGITSTKKFLLLTEALKSCCTSVSSPFSLLVFNTYWFLLPSSSLPIFSRFPKREKKFWCQKNKLTLGSLKKKNRRGKFFFLAKQYYNAAIHFCSSSISLPASGPYSIVVVVSTSLPSLLLSLLLPFH